MDFAAHCVEIASVLFVAYVGYALGHADLRIRPTLTAVTAVVAVILHGIGKLALPHEGIERIARAVAGSPQSPILVTVALVETARIWIPILVIRWAARRTRIWAAAYIVGAATVAASTNYAPSFDAPLPHPEYEAWLVLALVIATVPFAVGRIAKRRQRPDSRKTSGP